MCRIIRPTTHYRFSVQNVWFQSAKNLLTCHHRLTATNLASVVSDLLTGAAAVCSIVTQSWPQW